MASCILSTMSTLVTTTTALYNVPKLFVNGDNIVIFFIRFTWAIKSKGIWPHLDGSATCPQPPMTTPGTPGAAPTVQGPMTSLGTSPINPAIATYEAELEKWEKDKALTLNLLTQCIPDLTVVCTLTLKTTVAMWAKIIHEYLKEEGRKVPELCRSDSGYSHVLLPFEGEKEAHGATFVPFYSVK